jgi:hypothetical protein
MLYIDTDAIKILILLHEEIHEKEMCISVRTSIMYIHTYIHACRQIYTYIDIYI